MIRESIEKFITRALDNPHTSIASFSYVLCKLGKVWIPKYAAQFEATETIIVGYGFLAANDSKQPPQLPPSPLAQKI